MQAQFWHERWASNQIGFHESAVNALLVAHFAALGVSPPARLLLPLCGKTLDIDWLLARGYRVTGVELSSIAVAELFARLALVPVVKRAGELEHWSAAGLDVFVGDIFALTSDTLGIVGAIYDRAALIALPASMRPRYARHLLELAHRAPQLLVTLDYDQESLSGPPFSVGSAEVLSLYRDQKPTLLASQAVQGGLKGKCPATENAWLLQQHGARNAATRDSAPDPGPVASAR